MGPTTIVFSSIRNSSRFLLEQITTELQDCEPFLSPLFTDPEQIDWRNDIRAGFDSVINDYGEHQFSLLDLFSKAHLRIFRPKFHGLAFCWDRKARWTYWSSQCCNGLGGCATLYVTNHRRFIKTHRSANWTQELGSRDLSAGYFASYSFRNY